PHPRLWCRRARFAQKTRDLHGLAAVRHGTEQIDETGPRPLRPTLQDTIARDLRVGKHRSGDDQTWPRGAKTLRAFRNERGHGGVVVWRSRVGDLRVSHVVVMKTLDALARHDVPEHRERVLAGVFVLRIDVDPFPLAGAPGVA